jgi:hypothetical protein
MQGYGYQFNIDEDATVDTSTYFNAFYDVANIECEINGYTSFQSGPQIEAIRTNHNYTGFISNPTINEFKGNASYTGYGIYPTLGTMDGGGFVGYNCNPTIALVKAFADGINITMDNVTLYAGVPSELTVQDLSFEWINPGDNNGFTLAYTAGGTAGSEVVSILGGDIEVQIEDGVSTASQIKSALDASQFGSAVTTTISGVGSNPQTIFSATNFINGENAGQKRAAFLDGNVEITGDLSFQGALSIGLLNAFGSVPIADSPGQPGSAHILVSNPTISDNVTLTSGDMLGINTAMLLQIGDNSVVGTTFLGVAALGLPAVVTMGVGSTLDKLSGATFALSLDAGGTGGTIDVLNLCRSISIPNGVTGVNKQRGYFFDLPFGDPATETWGIYMEPDCDNFLKGSLKIGGTLNVSDKVTNSSCALEIESTTKALRISVMDETERDALTPLDGMFIVNTTAGKAQARVGGAWVDLH